MTSGTTVSVVVSTLDRADDLRRALTSFEWLDARVAFEVVVVVGPCQDDTDEVVARWGDSIKVERCDVANLSVSRNVGIRAAAGDIVAFIDDDGVPETEWLSDLVDAYDSTEIGAVGGWVYDHTGVEFQYRFGLVDRLGHFHPAETSSTMHYAFPGSFVFPHMLGTNSSFRRSVLLEIGGFDEEYEYFLDESDVHVRLIDAGYRVRQIEGAYVHHKFAPSAIRRLDRFARNRYSIMKNHTYFARRNAGRHLTPDQITADIDDFIALQRREMSEALERDVIDDETFERFESDTRTARDAGEASADRPRVLLTDPAPPPAFRPFPARGSGVRAVFPISGQSDRERKWAAARALAAEGGIPHVLLPWAPHRHVDFADGVWVHHVQGDPAVAMPREIDGMRARRTVDEVRS